jgi:dTDP-4-dehydrorhamnose 3,5-epimerase
MPITATPTRIPDVFVIEPRVFGDERGWFFESFNTRELEAAIGFSVNFVQDNHSLSKKGILRGLHYQLEQTQGKLVRVARGAVFDVAVDLRLQSPSYGQWVGIELSAENHKQLWIPPGLAHGFLVMSHEAEFLYKTTDYWHPQSEQCLAWNDPTIAIEWPNLDENPQLSAKDAAGVLWDQAKKFS